MPHQSLLGFLISTRVSEQAENLATESLHYILSQNPAATQALIRYLAKANFKIDGALHFKTQWSGEKDNCRPDMIGVDAMDRNVVIIESKFWAALTENQPVAYLKELPEATDSLLLFITPAKRITTIWCDLLRLCKSDSGSLIVGPEQKVPPDFHFAKIGAKRMLGVTSWGSILGSILSDLDSEGQIEGASDVRQLQGLCERMDAIAFLPLSSQALTPHNGTRLIQFCQLVDELISNLLNKAGKECGFTPVKGNISTAWGSDELYHGGTIAIHNCPCFIHFNAKYWSTLRGTPLWMSITGSDGKASQAIKDLLSSMEKETPSRLIYVDEKLLVPLYLTLGAEKGQVIDDLVSQVKEIAKLMGDNSKTLVLPKK
jgi:hypothetical protein